MPFGLEKVFPSLDFKKSEQKPFCKNKRNPKKWHSAAHKTTSSSFEQGSQKMSGKNNEKMLAISTGLKKNRQETNICRVLVYEAPIRKFTKH